MSPVLVPMNGVPTDIASQAVYGPVSVQLGMTTRSAPDRTPSGFDDAPQNVTEGDTTSWSSGPVP